MDDEPDDQLRMAVYGNFQQVADGTQAELEAEVERMQNLVSSAFWGLRNERLSSQS